MMDYDFGPTINITCLHCISESFFPPLKMRMLSWPEPPKPGRDPPEIPQRYTSFGMSYNIIAGAPVPTSTACGSLDKHKLKELINLSFSTFIRLITYPSDHEELIARISSIHSEINQLLNNAKRIEAASEMERIRNKHTADKNRIIEEIKKQMSNFEIE